MQFNERSFNTSTNHGNAVFNAVNEWYLKNNNGELLLTIVDHEIRQVSGKVSEADKATLTNHFDAASTKKYIT
jgi:tRNA(Ile)-lysidine synthase TilS/MesJ